MTISHRADFRVQKSQMWIVSGILSRQPATLASPPCLTRSAGLFSLSVASLMGGPSKKQRQVAQEDTRLTEALAYLRSIAASDPKPNSLLAVSRTYNVSYHKLRRRWRGETKPRNLAHEKQQILTSAQEQALVDWIVHLSDAGRPVNKRTLRKKVQRIRQLPYAPSRKWLRGFLGRHPELRLGKPSGLDPKRAQAFNEATVERHFDLLRKVMDEHGIPWAHVYNMDEKGIQRGSRQEVRYKCIIPRSRRPAYKLRSADLELVTVLECVRADGESLKPAFIFPGKEFHKEWFEVDDEILYAIFVTKESGY